MTVNSQSERATNKMPRARRQGSPSGGWEEEREE